MKVVVDGRTVVLGPKEFVAQGGEGSVYVRGATAYKLAADPQRLIPPGKVLELAAITDPRVILPERPILDPGGLHIGYTMRFVADTWTLCQLFTRTFREREGLGPDQVVELVERLRQGVSAVHAVRVVIVDLNELNFLVARDLSEIYFIDTDSYQTANYPATAIADHVRDRHAPPGIFTAGTDWFSFAVVSFQLQVGVHPYKGKHPTLKTLDERMANNVSVFDPAVRVPASAYPTSLVPPAWRDWYRAVFEAGERTPPPAPGRSPVAIRQSPMVHSGGALLMVELGVFLGRVRGVWEQGGCLVVASEGGVTVNGRAVAVVGVPMAVGFTASDRPIAVMGRGAELALVDLQTGAPLALTLEIETAISIGGRLYVKSGAQVLEIELRELGGTVVASPRLAANVLPHAAHLYPGCVVQQLLGATWVAVFPRPGVTYQHHLKELDGYQVVEARYDRQVLMVLGIRHGRWDRLVFRFARDFQSWDLRVVEDTGNAGLDFVTLDTGVVVTMDAGDGLELSSSAVGASAISRIPDARLGADVILSRDGGRLLAARGDRLYRLIHY